MSLFQVNEWWSSRSEAEQECGSGCLCVANIDNDSNGYDKVILGTYSGLLHLYSPKKSSTGLHDSLLEVNLENPVLQLAAGHFVPVDKDIHLAVLHPRLLSVYKFSKAVGEQEVSLKMQKIYQHKLERSAANMITGPFGRVKDKDFICVQSLDGAVSVFEQETFAFTRFLPGFLLPGPLAYTAHTDSFVTVSSAHTLEAYSYQVLAVATDSKTDDDEKTDQQSGKRIETDWSFVLGESALEIQIVNFSHGKPFIIVLGEHSLFCFDVAGKLEFMKKFEDPLSCIKSYPSHKERIPITVACTYSKKLLVYEGAVLAWAARLDDDAVVVETGNFGGIPGMIVIATEQCTVSCHYLGTSPAMFVLPRSKQRDLTLEKVDKDLDYTKQLISQQLASGDEIKEKDTKPELVVSLNIPKTIDKTSVATNRPNITHEFPSLTIQISLKVSRRINNVQVLIPVSKPLHSTLTSHCLSSLYDVDHPLVLHTSFFLLEKLIPSSLDCSVMVYYKKTNGSPQMMTSKFRLPLSLIASPSAPAKKLNRRVTLDTNMPCPNLFEIFPDFEGEQNTPNSIGLSYMNGTKAIILTSKSSNRYRIQCDEIDQLWLVTDELVYRLQQRYPQINISLAEPPNLEDYVPYIDQHFQLRKSVNEMRLLLQQRAQQHRIIQKRLLTRFKDKTPQPMLGLDTLLMGTHTQILALVDAMEENDKRLRDCSVRLSCAIRLLVLLTSLWRHMSVEEENRLRGAMAVEMTYTHSNAAGWEEMVDVSLMALLKTTLSRAGGDAHMSSAATLEMPSDTAKLKKHIAIVMDRLSKGGKLIGAGEKVGKQSGSTNSSRKAGQHQSPDNFSTSSSKKLAAPRLPETQLRLQSKPKPQTSIVEEDEVEASSENTPKSEELESSLAKSSIVRNDDNDYF